jgi:nucleotide-binding universal stress UspA family protein
VAQQTLDSARDCTVDCEGEVRFEAVAGKPAEVLARMARDRGAELIVVGSRGLGALRAAIGSVTLRLLHLAPCPVMVVPERHGDASEPAQ